jgi:hypothetical protein
MKTTIRVNNKIHNVEIINGQQYIDGKTVDEFMDELDPLTLIDFANVGRAALIDSSKGTKTHGYQKMMDRFSIMRG